MLDAEAFAAVHIVTNVLDDLEVRHVIGGSVASTAHGLIRTTMDVDLVADLEPQHLSAFISALSGQFYMDEPAVRRAIACRSSFNLIHLETMVKVDLFLAGDRAFDRQQLARRIAERVAPIPTKHCGS